MKKYRTAIVAFVLIVVALVSYFVVKQIRPGSSDESADETTKTFSMFPFSGDAAKQQIVQVEVFAEESFLLKKTSEGWVCPSWQDEEISQSEVQSMLGRICLYTGPMAYEGDVTEEVRQQFGFKEDAKFVVTMKDGKTYTAFIGGASTTGGSYYVWLEGSDQIILYAKAFREGIFLSKVDLISDVVFDFGDSGQIMKIDIRKNDQSFAYLTATFSGVQDEERQWTMSVPIQRAGHNSHITTFLNKLLAVKKEKLEVSDCEDLAAYGLSPAAYSVTLTAPDRTITLNIGNKTKDGNSYYFTVGTSTDVYSAGTSVISFKDASVIQYLDEDVFTTDYTNLSTVQITLNGKTHTMKYVFEGEDETFYFNGRLVPDDDRRSFSKVLAAVYILEITGLDLENAPETPSGEVLCTVRYEQIDGTVTTVTCTARDESTMYFYVDGAYTGGYGPRYSLTSSAENSGIQATIDALLEILK